MYTIKQKTIDSQVWSLVATRQRNHIRLNLSLQTINNPPTVNIYLNHEPQFSHFEDQVAAWINNQKAEFISNTVLPNDYSNRRCHAFLLDLTNYHKLLTEFTK